MILYFSEGSPSNSTYLRPAKINLVVVDNAKQALSVIDITTKNTSSIFLYARISKDLGFIEIEEVQNIAYYESAVRTIKFLLKVAMVSILLILVGYNYGL